MYKATILPLAKKDIRQAALWYNKQQKGLGKRFTEEVREKVRFARQNPEASNIRYESVRTTVLNVFPFIIHYIVDYKNTQIIVTAVLHTSRDPNVWKTR